MYLISSSMGNDSIALLQWAHERDLDDCYVIYADTGWGHPDWPARVEKGMRLAESYGFVTWTVRSYRGFGEWVAAKSMFPTNKYQWCTSYLKLLPFAEFLDFIDPYSEATVVVGKRRAESKKREGTQEFEQKSEYYTGRMIWNPLFKHTDKERNQLIGRTGFKPLPHRSMECCPCVNAGRQDLRETPETCLERVRQLEQETGKTMYSVSRYQGATGIDEVMEWAASGRGKFHKDQTRLWNYKGELCGSGLCGY